MNDTATTINPTLSATRARAGKVGAHRVHELIRLGKEYEKEHRLTPGRQRLKQLIALGRKYEQEHGLAPTKVKRKKRCKDPFGEFLTALARIVQPRHRATLKKMVASLTTQTSTNEASQSIQDPHAGRAPDETPETPEGGAGGGVSGG